MEFCKAAQVSGKILLSAVTVLGVAVGGDGRQIPRGCSVAAHSFERGLTQRELPPGEGNEQIVAATANISLGFCNVSNVYMYRV